MHGQRLTVPVSERDHIRGSRRAPKTLLEYGDYQCPYCGSAHQVVTALQQRLGDRLCFAYRNFPLTEVHPYAEQAAEAVEAAGSLGKFWEMHDLVFANQDALELENLAEYAATLGLDMRRFTSEIEGGTHLARVRQDFESGIRSGVDGTPTFFINNVKYEDSDDFETLLAALT